MDDDERVVYTDVGPQSYNDVDVRSNFASGVGFLADQAIKADLEKGYKYEHIAPRHHKPTLTARERAATFIQRSFRQAAGFAVKHGAKLVYHHGKQVAVGLASAVAAKGSQYYHRDRSDTPTRSRSNSFGSWSPNFTSSQRYPSHHSYSSSWHPSVHRRGTGRRGGRRAYRRRR